MTMHACPRCGLESHCSHGNWVDRHPAAAVTAGLLALTLMSMMLSIHPFAALTMIVVAGAAAARRFAQLCRPRWEETERGETGRKDA